MHVYTGQRQRQQVTASNQERVRAISDSLRNHQQENTQSCIYFYIIVCHNKPAEVTTSGSSSDEAAASVFFVSISYTRSYFLKLFLILWRTLKDAYGSCFSAFVKIKGKLIGNAILKQTALD